MCSRERFDRQKRGEGSAGRSRDVYLCRQSSRSGGGGGGGDGITRSISASPLVGQVTSWLPWPPKQWRRDPRCELRQDCLPWPRRGLEKGGLPSFPSFLSGRGPHTHQETTWWQWRKLCQTYITASALLNSHRKYHLHLISHEIIGFLAWWTAECMAADIRSQFSLSFIITSMDDNQREKELHCFIHYFHTLAQLLFSHVVSVLIFTRCISNYFHTLSNVWTWARASDRFLYPGDHQGANLWLWNAALPIRDLNVLNMMVDKDGD